MDKAVYIGIVVAVLYLCGRIGSDIYRRKGRAASTGLALGFVLGPLGVLFAHFTPRADLRHKRRCISCRRWIDERAMVCPHCRTGLRVVSGRR
jgi:rRNA maturation endonuclease Nob1